MDDKELCSSLNYYKNSAPDEDVEPMAQLTRHNAIRLVENPVHGQLNIAYKFTCAMEYKIDVVDLQGRPLRHYQNHGLEGNLFWDIGDLSSGNYLIKATYGSGAVDMIKFTLIP